jgi:hypothetical protein
MLWRILPRAMGINSQEFMKKKNMTVLLSSVRERAQIWMSHAAGTRM